MFSLSKKDWPSLLGIQGTGPRPRQFGPRHQTLVYADDSGGISAVSLALDLGSDEEPARLSATAWDGASGADRELYSIAFDQGLAGDLAAPGDDMPVAIAALRVGGQDLDPDAIEQKQLLRLLAVLKDTNRDVVAAAERRLEGAFTPFAQRVAAAGLADLVAAPERTARGQAAQPDDGAVVLPAAVAAALFGVSGDTAPHRAHDEDLRELDATYGAERSIERAPDGTISRIAFGNHARIGGERSDSNMMAEVRFEPAGDGMVRVSGLRAGDGDLDPTDGDTLVRAAGAFRAMSAELDQGRMPDGLTALAEAGLANQIGILRPPPSLEDGGRLLYRSRGGINLNGVGPVAAEIGRNANSLAFDYLDGDAHKSEAIAYDVGIGTSDPDETGYHEYYSDMRENFADKNDPAHTPEAPAHFLFIGHPHFDHDGGAPHLVKDGLDIPFVLGNAYAIAGFKAKSKALGIPNGDMPPVIETRQPRDLPPAELEAYRALTPEQRWAHAQDKGWLVEGTEYPFKVGEMTFRTGQVTHSTPTTGLIVETPAGSARLNGDYKLDEMTDEAFLRYPVDLATAEGTSLITDGENPTQADLEESYAKVMEREQGRDMLFVQFSSSVYSMTTIAASAAKAQTGRTVVPVGAMMEQSFRWLNTLGLDRPDWPKAKNRNLKDYIEHHSFTRLLADEIRSLIDSGQLIDGKRARLLESRAEESGKPLAEVAETYRKDVDALVANLDQGILLPPERLYELNWEAEKDGKPTFATRRKQEEKELLQSLALLPVSRIDELRQRASSVVGADSQLGQALIEGKGEPGQLLGFLTGVHMEKNSATDKLFNNQAESKVDLNLSKTTVVLSQGPSIPSEKENYSRVVQAFVDAGAKVLMPDETKTGHYVLQKDKEREHRKGEPLYSSGHSHLETFKKHARLQEDVGHFVVQHGDGAQIERGEQELEGMGRKILRATNQTGIALTRDGQPEIVGPFIDKVQGVKYNREPGQYWTPTGIDDREKTEITLPLLPENLTKLSPSLSLAAMVSRARHQEAMAHQQKVLEAVKKSKSALDQFKELGSGGPSLG